MGKEILRDLPDDDNESFNEMIEEWRLKYKHIIINIL